MSIATETQRLIQSKADLKYSIEKRGANITADDRIDTFASVLDSCPYAVEGTFVPEEDTKTFSLSGLPFAPTSLLLICSDEVAKSSNKTPDAVVCSALQKGLYGSLLYSSASGGSQLGSVKPTSSMVQWNADGINFTISSTLTSTFKTGLIYTYYITGGIEL